MSWVLEFQAPEGKRIQRYFWSCTVRDRREPSMWWVDDLGRWLPCDDPDLKKYCHGSHSKPIRTLKAFCRFLRRHPELKGRDVALVNRYIGFDVIARAVDCFTETSVTDKQPC